MTKRIEDLEYVLSMLEGLDEWSESDCTLYDSVFQELISLGYCF